jgi:hypothetical protein
MFAKPEVGARITVTTEYPEKRGIYASYVFRGPYFKIGVVVKSEKYDDFDSFRLLTENKAYPISVIPLDRVTALVYESGEVAKIVVDKKPAYQTWQVKSDSRKGGFYTIVLEKGHYSCDCMGFQYRKTCRHINRLKEEESKKIAA